MRIDGLSKGVWGFALPNDTEKCHAWTQKEAGYYSNRNYGTDSSSTDVQNADGSVTTTTGYDVNSYNAQGSNRYIETTTKVSDSGSDDTGEGDDDTGEGDEVPEPTVDDDSGSGSGYYYYSDGGGTTTTDTTPSQPTESDDTSLKTLLNSEAAAAKTQSVMDSIPDASIDRINNVDTAEEEAILNQIKSAQEEQAINTIDYGTTTSIQELQRAEQDAQETYDTQRNQIAIDEQRALDNQALYSRSRGDNGGIGLAQYNSIQNTAAVNELTVNNEQTKLATDTERQIQDLRAQGEYSKADELLSISQNYLSQLMTLKQWAKETNVSIDEFNAQLAEWEANYKLSLVDAELSVANATGAFGDGTSTYTAWANAQSQLASVGNALISAGIVPSAQQLEAMGYTADQATAYINYMKSKGNI